MPLELLASALEAMGFAPMTPEESITEDELEVVPLLQRGLASGLLDLAWFTRVGRAHAVGLRLIVTAGLVETAMADTMTRSATCARRGPWPGGSTTPGTRPGPRCSRASWPWCGAGWRRPGPCWMRGWSQPARPQYPQRDPVPDCVRPAGVVGVTGDGRCWQGRPRACASGSAYGRGAATAGETQMVAQNPAGAGRGPVRPGFAAGTGSIDGRRSPPSATRKAPAWPNSIRLMIATGSSPSCRCRDASPSPSRDGATPR